MQEEIDQNYAPVEVVQEEERLRKEREGVNKEALQVRAIGLPTTAYRRQVDPQPV